MTPLKISELPITHRKVFLHISYPRHLRKQWQHLFFLKLQKEVLLAASVEDGYVRLFTIPIQLDNNINYTLTTKNYTITVVSANSIYTFTIPNSIGNVTKGPNKINKTGGVIYIN